MAPDKDEKDSMMRVFIADDQKKLRFALRILLEQQPELEVVGEAADASELMIQARVLQPDLVIVSWGLSGAAPVSLMRSLRHVCPNIYIVIISERQERDAWRLALAAGADAYASKANPPARLMSIIKGHWDHWRLTMRPAANAANTASFAESG